MWHHKAHAGDYITFLLCTNNGEKANAAEYLDNICRIIKNEEEPLEIIIKYVYQPLTVYVSLLEDPDAEPTGSNIEDISELEALPDEWMPLYLAIVLQHVEAIVVLLTFHQRHAYYILGKSTLQNNVNKQQFSFPTETGESLQPTTDNLCKAVVKKSCDEVKCATIMSSAKYGLDGAVIFLPSEENNEKFAEEEGEEIISNSVISLVTSALRPLLKSLVCEIKCVEDNNNNNNNKDHFEFGFVTRVIQAHCRNETGHCDKFSSSLMVNYDVLYDVCHGDINTLCDILKLFSGLLLPVVFVRCLNRSNNNNNNISIELTNNNAQDERCCVDYDVSHDSQNTAGTQFFLLFAAQEHHRLAFLAMWIAHREKMLVLWQKLHDKEAQERCYYDDKRICKFQTVLRQYKKIMCETSSSLLWSGHLFVLSKLLSSEYSVENFLEVIKGDYFLCSFEIPAVFIAVLVAAAAISTFINKPHYVQSVCEKMELILADHPHGAVLPLRRYLLSSPATHAERFETLWLAKTPFSQMMKFETRGELLYFALVEVVLLRAEKVWEKSANSFFVDCGEREDARFFLQKWLKMCWGIFASLAEQPLSAKGEKAEPCLFANSDDVADGESATGSYERSVMRRLCTAMRLRIKEGSQPLPSLDTSTFTTTEEEEMIPTKGICGDGDHNLEDDGGEIDVVAAFGAAQAFFVTMASRTSDDVKLKFYGLYKQATVGDVNVSKPWIMDSVGRAKWEAWNKLKGMSSLEAMRKYVLELRSLQVLL